MTSRPTLEVLATMIDNLTGPLRTTATTVESMSTKMNSAFKGIAAGLAGMFAFNFAKGALEAAAQLDGAMANIRAAIMTTKSSWGEARGSIDATLNSLDKFTVYTRTDLANVLGRMIEATGNVTVAEESLTLATNIAKARTVDLAIAGDLVAKAAAGNTKAFKLMGVTLHDNETPMQALVRVFGDFTGNVAPNARDMILSVSKAWEEAKVTIGEAMITQGAAGQSTNELADDIRTLGKAIALLAGGVVHGVGMVFTGVKRIGAGLGAAFYAIPAELKVMAGAVIDLIGTMISDSIGKIPVIGRAWKELGDSMQATGSKMETAGKQAFKNIADGFRDSVVEIDDGSDASTARQKANYEALAAQSDVSNIKTTKSALAAALAREKGLVASWARSAVDATGQSKIDLDRQIADGKAAIAIYEAGAQQKVKIDKKAAAGAAAAEKTAAAALKVIQDGALKEFSGETSTAVEVLKEKVRKLTEQADKWAASTDPKIRAQAAAVYLLAEKYQNIVPVLTNLGTLAAQVAATEKDPNRIVALRQLNVELDQAQLLEAEAGQNTEALKAAKDLVLKVQKDITAETTKTVEEEKKLKQWSDAHLVTQQQLKKFVEGVYAAEAKHATKVAEETERAAHAAIGFASQAGLIDSQMASVLNSAVGIAQSLTHGDYIGAVAGLGNILLSVLNDPQAAAERALLAHNSEQLRALTAVQGKLVDQNDSGTKIQRVLDALNKVTASPTTAGGALALNSATVAGNLLQAGGSFQDVADLAKSLGIDLGKTNAETGLALFQLREALKQFKPQAFASDFQGQLDQASFQHSLTGGSGNTISDYAAAASGTTGSPFITALFAGMDPNNLSPADLQTLAGRIRGAGGQVNSLTTAQMGGLSESQITSTLSTLAGLIPAPAAGTPAPATPFQATGTPTPTPSGATTPAPNIQAPSLATVLTVVDSAGFNFKSICDCLGPKIDLTNTKLGTIGSKLDQVIANTGGMADALGNGKLLKTINSQLQVQAAVSKLANGVIS